MKTVTIYSTLACPWCKATKEFLKKHKIEYVEKDVSIDAEARDEMLQKTDQLGVPVVEIGDEIIIGFNEEVMAELLGLEI